MRSICEKIKDVEDNKTEFVGRIKKNKYPLQLKKQRGYTLATVQDMHRFYNCLDL